MIVELKTLLAVATAAAVAIGGLSEYRSGETTARATDAAGVTQIVKRYQQAVEGDTSESAPVHELRLEALCAAARANANGHDLSVQILMGTLSLAAPDAAAIVEVVDDIIGGDSTSSDSGNGHLSADQAELMCRALGVE